MPPATRSRSLTPQTSPDHRSRDPGADDRSPTQALTGSEPGNQSLYYQIRGRVIGSPMRVNSPIPEIEPSSIMNGSEVFEVNVPEGNYGAVTSKSQFLNERSSKNQRRVNWFLLLLSLLRVDQAVYSSMVAACLAFVGVLALSRSDKGHIYTSASQKMIAARKMLKSATQKLGAMESYDDSSGLLHTMYSEPGTFAESCSCRVDRLPGFEVVMYWKAEPSFSDLTGKITDLKSLLGKPDARTFHPALHFASYSDIAEAAGPSLPANNSADYSKFVAIFHGR
eukprot:766367-Hanusia_phi.AAC.4